MSFQRIDHDETKPEGTKSIIIYGYTEKEIEAIRLLGQDFDIEDFIVTDKSMSGLTLGELVEGKREEKTFKGAVAKRSIIMNAFSNKDVQEFIEAVKKSDIKKPIFAVVTPTSARWQLGKLIKELVLESVMMSNNQRKKHK
ncbi:DUF3783 domain-containing protein [Vallitalea okinawensis]|uniref:DUF3783 domain-containing protein n=1 Tax=Vallitalea okinawensis TaxID=2078660 RepID=UPI000CFBB208|nr:DUF3783 domain-containing protein [Vallitalea okinawensis]